MKTALKRLAHASGYFVSSVDRLGVDVDIDVARLAAADPISTIFDVGANFGQTALRLARSFPAATIHSFEPVPNSYAKMVANVGHLANVRPFNLALGETAGSAHIHLAACAGSNTMKSSPLTNGAIPITVERLDRFADEHGVDAIDLLKIDVEGFELPVLRGAAGRLRQGKIRFIYAECVFAPNSEMPHTSFFDLHQFLAASGYVFVTYYAESFNLKLGCALGNALFALKRKLPDHVSGKVHNIV